MARERFVQAPGYTQIPNELLDQALSECTLAESRVLFKIARRTFGWGITERRFSLSGLQELTELSRQSVQTAVTSLIEKGWLRRRREGHGFVYGIPIATAKMHDSSASGEESKDLTSGSPSSRPSTSKGNKTLRGKQNSKGAGAPTSAKEGDIKGKEGATFKPVEGDEVHAVIVELFEFWISNTPQPPGTKLTVKRAKQIRSRMREQAEGCKRETALATARERMLEGLQGWVNSPWHKEREAFDFDVLFRSRGKVEKFRGDFFRAQQAKAKKPEGDDFSGYGGAVERG